MNPGAARRGTTAAALFLTATTLFPALAEEIGPLQRRLDAVGGAVGTFSPRTIVASIEIDRDAIRLVGYTLKDRPFVRSIEVPRPRALADGRSVQAEVILHGEGDLRYTQRVDAGRLCLLHGAGTPAHIQGDTILVHRDTFIVELPELAGFDRVEVAYYGKARGGRVRHGLGVDTLDASRFSPAAGSFSYADLAFANESLPDPPRTPTASDLLWPEDFDDPDIYRLEGDESQAGARINVVVLPDGYRYAEKTTMDAHFDAMVSEFRSVTPYKEHDSFLNYTLVYAYSLESGTDQCDCGIIRNTAMATAFPQVVPTCGDSENRCLYYTGGCEPPATSNITAAELRAPAHDQTVIMVNTSRYGGCGGARAVYSAGNSAADQVAVHELGHSLGGLADEYVSEPGCGISAGEVNTSTNATDGAWPEWIGDIGAPREGAQYWSECIYRPIDTCTMRELNVPFCPVCNQQWAKTYFAHSRVGPTAPVSSYAPGSFINIPPDAPQLFQVTTRFAEGPAVTNDITWRIEGPGFPSPTVVATDTTDYVHSFAEEGIYTLSVEVIADTNFIKPSEYDANVDTVPWLVVVSVLPLPPEISAPGHNPLYFQNKTTIWWEEASGLGVDSYNLYRGDVANLSAGDYGDCLQTGLGLLPMATVEEEPAPGVSWIYLITGVNEAGEGPMGFDSFGALRFPGVPCP